MRNKKYMKCEDNVYMDLKEKQRNKRLAILKKSMMFCMMLLVSTLIMSTPVFASSAVEGKFTGFKDIVVSFVTGIGLIITLWGIFEFGNAMQTQEGGATSQAMKRVGGGLVMIIAPEILNAMV